MKRLLLTAALVAMSMTTTACEPEDNAQTALAKGGVKGKPDKRPVDPTPTPTPTPPPTTTVQIVLDPLGFEKMVPIADGLDLAQYLRTTSLAPTGVPDVVGAHRFLCAPSHVAYDDSIIYPNQSGKAHLHQFFGNTGADANSTFSSLRTTGDSTCINKVNRSAYWQPAMIGKNTSGDDVVIVPDYHNIYYKRRPSSDPEIGGIPVDTPNGSEAIFGWDANASSATTYSPVQWRCARPDGSYSTSYRGDMRLAIADGCAAGGGSLLSAVSSSTCWSGKLKSADNRSHYRGPDRNAATNWKVVCPATHPYVVPVYTLQNKYTINASDVVTSWRLSSDREDLPPGWTFHFDVVWAWNDEVKNKWHRACIDKLLSCNDMNLGDGFSPIPSQLYRDLRAKAANGLWRQPVPPMPSM